jgi:gas vesicle structural protein
MTVAAQAGGGGVERASSASLADVVDTILDKGLVIDAYVRVSLVGIELLTIDTRVVVASVDTYLRFAEAVNRLDLTREKEGLPELIQEMQEGGARHKTKGAVEGAVEAAAEKVRSFVDDRGEKRESAPRRRRRQGEE